MQFREVKMAELPYGAVTSTIINADGASVFEQLITSGKVDQLADPKQIAGLKAALDISARDYLKAMRVRLLVQQEFRRLLTDVDVLLAPARYTVATKLTEPLDRTSSMNPPAPSPGLRALIPAGNLAGVPALSLPCGFAEGLPVALQLVSRPWTENTILSIGKEFQAHTDWHRRRPPVS
jgi:aspartyl-tRNA(Asn)/glutamyl-tRNA(Gln) amidotransferase subunit A